jgi:hypothetical protein
MDWLWSNALEGVKLLVKEEDAQVALELLDQEPIEKFDASNTGEYKQPRCPNCDSLNLSFKETGKHLSYVTVAVGVPLPVKRGGGSVIHVVTHGMNLTDQSRTVQPLAKVVEGLFRSARLPGVAVNVYANDHAGFWVHTRMALTGVVGHTTSHAPQPMHLSLTTG